MDLRLPMVATAKHYFFVVLLLDALDIPFYVVHGMKLENPKWPPHDLGHGSALGDNFR